MAMGQHQWYHFGVGAPPMLVYLSGDFGMFTGGTIWILTHGQIGSVTRRPNAVAVPRMVRQTFADAEEESCFKAGLVADSPQKSAAVWGLNLGVSFKATKDG